MQAKDISDDAVLEAVRAHQRAGHPWATQWNVRDRLMPRVGPVPDKVLRAKLRALIRRGFLDGYACGCRGDSWLTPTGITFLNRADGPYAPLPA